MKTLSNSQRGSALLIVLMILALLASTVIALLQVTISNTGITDNTRDSYQALLLAQAGMNHAIAEFNLNKVIGSDNHALGNPSVSWGYQQNYAVTTTPNADGTWTITSTGTMNYDQSAGNITRVQRKLVAVVARPVSAGNFLAGGFGKASVTVTGLAQTDSYDSAIGTTYAAQVAAGGGLAAYDRTIGNGGHVASNGPIFGNGNTIVHGNATPGPGNTVTLTGGAQVTGSTAPAPSNFEFSSYVYNPPIASSGDYQLSGNGAVTIGAGTYRWDSFKQSGQVLTFTGAVNVYIDGDFTQAGQAQIVIAPGATLTIYQGPSGKLDVGGQGVVNTDQIPSRFNIVSASTSTVSVTGQGDIYGTTYAPDADVKISGQGQFFGGVIGNELTLNGLGEFHYDKSATSPGIVTNVVVLSYWEVDM